MNVFSSNMVSEAGSVRAGAADFAETARADVDARTGSGEDVTGGVARAIVACVLT